MIDNYDSFTYNLVQYFQELGQEVVVFKNDQLDLADINQMNLSGIVISPGPCTPNESGISLAVIERFYQHLPILGVCLGHQAIAQFFGAKIVGANQVMHGKTSDITHNGQGLFSDLPMPLKVTRYHSLVVDPYSVPPSLCVTAQVDDQSIHQGTIMGIQHQTLPVFGVQFHPESILSQSGHQLLQNFVQYCVN
jgi:anthranilate synthase/aminodeoxychorismate synthase-like glutamine amidotransferase